MDKTVNAQVVIPSVINIKEIIAATTRAVLQARLDQKVISPPTIKPQLSYSDIGSQIPLFGETDDEISAWICRVNEVQQAYGVADNIIKVLATNKLRGRIRDWYDSTPGIISKSWDGLKTDMITLFGSYESRVSLIRKMESRKWRAGEKFTDYFCDKIKLTNKLELAEVDVIQYVIEGIDIYVLRTYAIAARYTKLSKLLEAMKLMSEDQPNKPRQSQLDDHYASSCTLPKRLRGSYFLCGKMGHKQNECPSKMTTTLVSEKLKDRQIEENEKSRTEAKETFDKYDSNKDGKHEISERQTRPAFDKDRNGEITEEDARYFLNEHTELESEDFHTIAWPKIEPIMMLESGLFKPSFEEPAIEADDMHETEDEEEVEHHENEKANLEEYKDAEGDTDHEHVTEKECLVSNKPEHNKETQKLIKQTTDAHNEFSNADQAFKNIQIKIEESLEQDYREDEEFASLDGQCFEYHDIEYIYKLCPFDQVVQKPNSGGFDTRIGTWSSWVGTEESKYDIMPFDRGRS